MKRKIFAVGLSLVAAATVIGSGFSAWYFGTAAATVNPVNLTIGVTEQTGGVGTITTPTKQLDGKKIMLDQGGSGDSDKKDLTKGIYVADPSTPKVAIETAKHDYHFEISKTDYTKLADAKLQLDFTSTITIKKGLCEYVELAGATASTYGTAKNVSGDDVYTFTKTLGTGDTTGVTAEHYGFSVVTDFSYNATTHVNSGLKYKATMKPQDSGKYGEMVTSIGNIKGNAVTITFSYVLTDISNNA